MILKIQKPLVTNDTTPKALIYNRDKSKIWFMNWNSIKFLFQKHELKIYIRGTVQKDGVLRVYKILAPAKKKCQF